MMTATSITIETGRWKIEPRLEEVLETHLRYHAVFQVTFLRGEPATLWNAACSASGMCWR